MERRKVSELKQGDLVVFRIDAHGWGKKYSEYGHVYEVRKEEKKVDVHWLCGYQDRHDKIPFEDVLAVHDENGEWMDFDGVRGRSLLLLPE